MIPQNRYISQWEGTNLMFSLLHLNMFIFLQFNSFSPMFHLYTPEKVRYRNETLGENGLNTKRIEHCNCNN